MTTMTVPASGAPPTQFAVLTDKGVSAVSSPHSRQTATTEINTAGSSNRSIVYSSNGLYLAIVQDSSVVIYDSHNLDHIVNTIEVKGVVEADFSPLGTYISTWCRYVKAADEKDQIRNMSLFRVSDGKPIGSFVQKTQSNWKVQWTGDESLFARLTSEVYFHDPKDELDQTNKLPIKGRISGDSLTSFSISPNKKGGSFAGVFSKEKNGTPGSVKLYELESLPSESGPKCLSTRTMFNADSVDFLWNDDGSSVLVHTHTDVDKSNQSYYGKSTLHQLTTVGPAFATQIVDLTNPIHSISWSPNSKEFIAIHGAMPSKCTLFGVNASHPSQPSTAVYEFPPSARNSVTYSPHGRLILTAGFGNLAGDLTIWDRADFKQLCTMRATNASAALWSPDGRHILTATVYRRLKVDNGVRVFHHSGVLVANMDARELHAVMWRPEDPARWPMKRALSPKPEGIQDPAAVKKATIQPTAGKYVPPALRGKLATGSASSISKAREEQLKPAGPVGVVGLVSATSSSESTRASTSSLTEEKSKTAVKNAKKRENKKAQGGDSTRSSTQSLNPSSAPAVPAFIPTEADSKALEIEKKVKAVQKKLKQIAELKKKQAGGDALEITQVQKIATEDSLLKELAELNLQLQQ
ncbi:hypothetical protein HDU84_000042 [Entophlyctis sp. JEL0112]|nr:hypothetical protein HDU84_000042 [Entophlyctis sp. JEL0112]